MSKTILVAIIVFLTIMATQSMNAADTIEKKISKAAPIHTAIYNQFQSSPHFRSW